VIVQLVHQVSFNVHRVSAAHVMTDVMATVTALIALMNITAVSSL